METTDPTRVRNSVSEGEDAAPVSLSSRPHRALLMGHQSEGTMAEPAVTPPQSLVPRFPVGRMLFKGSGLCHVVLVCGLGLDPGAFRATVFSFINKEFKMSKFQMAFSNEIFFSN